MFEIHIAKLGISPLGAFRRGSPPGACAQLVDLVAGEPGPCWWVLWTRVALSLSLFRGEDEATPVHQGC